jgi:hypothetical protein
MLWLPSSALTPNTGKMELRDGSIVQIEVGYRKKSMVYRTAVWEADGANDGPPGRNQARCRKPYKTSWASLRKKLLQSYKVLESTLPHFPTRQLIFWPAN